MNTIKELNGDRIRQFSDLNAGDAFRFANECYMKVTSRPTPSSLYNAVNLADGILNNFSVMTSVERLPSLEINNMR